jgi:hypothetical protein
VDVFPYTRTEMELMRLEDNALISRALREGLTIFRRTSGADGL